MKKLKELFMVLLIASFSYEVLTLLTLQRSYDMLTGNIEYDVFRIFMNLIYSIWLGSSIVFGYWWAGTSILLLAILRDAILVPYHIFSIEFAMTDSIICMIIMVIVFTKEIISLRPVLWTEKDISERTEINTSFLDLVREKLALYDADEDNSNRIQLHQCKLCHYVVDNPNKDNDRCKICNKKLSGKDKKICPECASQHHICTVCGGKIDSEVSNEKELLL